MKNALLTTFLALAVLSLPGCSTTKFETRVACVYAGGEAQVISKWWLFGISTQLAEADAGKLCPVKP